MLIRAATEADRDAIVALHLASWQSSYGIVLPARVLSDVLPDYLAVKWAPRGFGPDQPTLVAEAGGEVLGFVCALRDVAPPLVDNLHVHPTARGRGTGAQLLAAINKALAATGAAASTLTVLEANTRAIAFYRAQGGRDAGPEDDMLVGHPVKVRRFLFDLA
ncbi:GNAT family N-acetyltransferase [uncultured Jannaschia sp.]|uniref:GNAT family N-acetyltransferase n=1 Tax=uncultured Jannaschia sp. TaxID=293347 RepID=UPI0026093C69|nr:GNAT family N-acetyltransferase [uncultured Jannaschia sp.]